MEAARRATAGDLDAVLALVRQAIAELRPNRGGTVWSRREAHREPVEESFGPWLIAPTPDDPVVVVGTVDDVVVGYGVMGVEALHDNSPLAVISDLYVDPEARGIGVGEAMMDVLEAEARRCGAIGLDAIVLPGDRHSKNFFETFGLTARAILVHRSLVDEDGPTDEAG